MSEEYTDGTDRLVKTCQYGHYWYTGKTCPLCDYLGRNNLREVRTATEQEGSR
jgi:hypothetical protein